MSTMTEQATQVYCVFIRATPEQVWDAITKPQFTERYFHGVRIEVDGEHRRSSVRGLAWAEPVLEYDPPRRLVHGWTSAYSAELAAEPSSRVTWEIEPQADGTTLLTVVHDRLDNSPLTAANVSGVGWMYVLSNLKTFLETGEPLAG